MWPGRRGGKKGKLQIEYGLLTDPQGRPVAIRVFAGNTADPTAFINAVSIVREKFALTELTLVGDRGMITSALARLTGDGLFTDEGNGDVCRAGFGQATPHRSVSAAILDAEMAAGKPP